MLFYPPWREWLTKGFWHVRVLCTAQAMFTLSEHINVPPCRLSSLENVVSSAFILLISSYFLDS